MPFCNSCGNRVDERDRYCSKCGGQQAIYGAPPFLQPPMVDPLPGMSPRTASVLCYVPVVGWIAAVVVLASNRFRRDTTVRFHAFQGLYLFASWLVVNWALRPIFRSMGEHIFRLDELLEALLFGASIFMLIKTRKNQMFSLPILGDLAQRSAMES